jgi:hypothetical protein
MRLAREIRLYDWAFLRNIVFFYSIIKGKAGHLHTSSTAATDMTDGKGNIVTTLRHLRPNIVYSPIECPPGVQEHFSDPYDCSAFHYCNGMLNDNYFQEKEYFRHTL